MNDTFDLFLLDWSAAHFVALMDSIIQPLRHHEKSQPNENSQQKYIEKNKKPAKIRMKKRKTKVLKIHVYRQCDSSLYFYFRWKKQLNVIEELCDEYAKRNNLKLNKLCWFRSNWTYCLWQTSYRCKNCITTLAMCIIGFYFYFSNVILDRYMWTESHYALSWHVQHSKQHDEGREVKKKTITYTTTKHRHRTHVYIIFYCTFWMQF